MRFFICVDVYKIAELFPGKYFVEKLVDFVEYFPEINSLFWILNELTLAENLVLAIDIILL